MIITIKQNGGEKYNHPLFKKATVYFINKLFTETQKKKINKITLTITPRSINKIRGDCSEEIDNNGRYTAYINLCKVQPITEIISTIAHELVHLEQAIKRRLLVENDVWMWKGKKFKFSQNDYKHLTYYKMYNTLPWEREAYDMETKLAKSFFNNFYSKQN